MKGSQKNRKMPKNKKVFIEILKVFGISFKISLGLNALLLVLNSMTGGFIGFGFYMILTIVMGLALVPCIILCDSKRIFSNKSKETIKIKSSTRKPRERYNDIKRKKIS